MGQEESTVKHKQFELPQRGGKKVAALTMQRYEHEGILKLRDIPFRNSIQISHQPSLFLETSDATLGELLQSRYNTTKLFTEDDIVKLVESILYTLSFLQSKQVSYTDLCQDNIYYDAQTASFKLLPIELIKDSAYELAKSGKRFSLLAPELVIAMRYGQSEIESDIQDRSNVFSLGMILLETLTLLPSQECYDAKSYDILDEVVTARLTMAREFYPEFLVRLVERMLEYDYVERCDLKNLSIQMNREISESRVMTRTQIKMPSASNQTPNLNSRVQYKPANLGKSQMRFHSEVREEPTQMYAPSQPQLRQVVSSQYPSAQGPSPSRQPVDRHYSQPSQPHQFDPQQSNVSTYSYVCQPPPQPAYPQQQPHPYAQPQSSHPYQTTPFYDDTNEQAETPRYNAIEEFEEPSEDPRAYCYQRPPAQQPAYPNKHTYAPTGKQQVYSHQQYGPPTQQFEPPRLSVHAPSPVNYNDCIEEQGYHSPIDETRDPKRNMTPGKRSSSPHLYKPAIINNHDPQKYLQVVNRPSSPSNKVFRNSNQQEQQIEKSATKRRPEYVSPILSEDITDNSITRLKEEIEKSRRLIMQFQRMEGLGEQQNKNKKFLPA